MQTTAIPRPSTFRLLEIRPAAVVIAGCLSICCRRKATAFRPAGSGHSDPIRTGTRPAICLGDPFAALFQHPPTVDCAAAANESNGAHGGQSSKLLVSMSCVPQSSCWAGAAHRRPRCAENDMSKINGVPAAPSCRCNGRRAPVSRNDDARVERVSANRPSQTAGYRSWRSTPQQRNHHTFNAMRQKVGET